MRAIERRIKELEEAGKRRAGTPVSFEVCFVNPAGEVETVFTIGPMVNRNERSLKDDGYRKTHKGT